MTKTGHLLRYVRKRIKDMKASADRIIRNKSIEAIHPFRIEYKRLRAFLRLMRKANDHPELLFLPGNLKVLYRLAGSVRDRQLHLDILTNFYGKENERPSGYISKLAKEEESRFELLISKLSSFSFEELEDRLEKNMDGRLTNKTVRKYHRSRQKKLTALKQDPGSDINIHEIRKCIKDLIYNSGFLKDAHADGAGIRKNKAVKKIEQDVGEFNDLRESLTFLKRKIPESASEERGRLEMVKKGLDEKKLLLRQNILKELEALPASE